MDDAWYITFSGHGFSADKIFTATDGCYDFTPGLRRRRVIIRDLAPGCGQVVKDNGYAGATHRLTLYWMTTSAVAATVWAAAYAKAQTAFDGVSGTLTVPGFPAFANCVVIDSDCGPQTAITQATPLNARSTTFTDGYYVAVTLVFQQLGG
jgi:hypothetical protein